MGLETPRETRVPDGVQEHWKREGNRVTRRVVVSARGRGLEAPAGEVVSGDWIGTPRESQSWVLRMLLGSEYEWDL